MSERGPTLLERIVAFFRQAREPVAARGVEPSPPVVVTQDGFVDVELGLRRLPPDRPARFRLAATTNGRDIGFDVALVENFSQTEIGPGIPIWLGSVRISSIGAASDAFLAFLDERYETARNPRRMRQEVRAAAILLEGNPSRPEEGLRIKLFFEEQGELEEIEDDEEGPRPGTPEVYLNLEPRRGRASWAEKDEGYRSDLIFALTDGDGEGRKVSP